MKNLSLKAKLYTLSGFLIAMAALIGGCGYWATKSIEYNYSKIANVNFPNTRNLLEAYLQFRAARAEIALLGLPDLDEEKGQKIIAKVDEYWQKYDQEIKDYEDIPFMPGEDELFKGMQDS